VLVKVLNICDLYLLCQSTLCHILCIVPLVVIIDQRPVGYKRIQFRCAVDISSSFCGVWCCCQPLQATMSSLILARSP